MGAYDLLAAIAAAGIAVAAVVAVSGRGSVRLSGRRGDLVRYAAVAGLSALVCAVMNIVESVDGAVVAAAVGNATNVFALAMLWAMARRLNGRREIGVATSGASSLLVLAATFVVPLDDGTLIKTAVMAVFAVLAAAELRRGAMRATPGSGTVALALLAFAVYCVGRLIVAFGSGMGSWMWNSFTSAEVTSIASAVAILAATAGVVRMGRALDDDPEPGTRAFDRSVLKREASGLMAQHPGLVGLTIDIPEIDLIRAAHGADRADAVVGTLLEATREALPGSVAGTSTRETVVAFLPGDVERAGIGSAVRERFARSVPRAGYDDTPDVRITQRAVGDPAALEDFLETRRRRRRAPWRLGQP